MLWNLQMFSRICFYIFFRTIIFIILFIIYKLLFYFIILIFCYFNFNFIIFFFNCIKLIIINIINTLIKYFHHNW